MPGKEQAVQSGRDLEDRVALIGEELELLVSRQVEVARRIWGAKRFIDIVLKHPETRVSLGIECKYQAVTGTAEEKIPAVINDIAAWPIPGLVVFAGEGFTDNMKLFLISTGKAVEFSELEAWLCLFFGLPLDRASKEPRLPFGPE